MRLRFPALQLILLAGVMASHASAATPQFWYENGTQKTWPNPNESLHEQAYAQKRAAPGPNASDPAKGDWNIAKRDCAGLKDYLFKDEGTDSTRKGFHTDAALVIEHGNIVFEEYSSKRLFGPATKHLSWSMAKSITNALLGFSLGPKYLGGAKNLKFSLTDRVSKYYSSQASGQAPALNILHFLHMSPSIKWAEDYENSPIDSNATNMLYVEPGRDMAGYTLRLQPKLAPGSFWQYASGYSNVVEGVIKRAFEMEWGEQQGIGRYHDMAFDFFNSIGIKDVVFETDGSGTFIGSSYAYMSARDFARFGFLYLNDGVWGGQQILPQGWVDMTRHIAPAYLSPDTKITSDSKLVPWPAIQDTGVGAAQFWLNVPVAREEGGKVVDYGRPYDAAPTDLYAALGHWGQYIFIIPSLDLVIVRLGEDRDYAKESRFEPNKFLSKALACYGQSNKQN